MGVADRVAEFHGRPGGHALIESLLTGGPATPVTVFAAGSYALTAGIYAPPASKPEKESTQTVQVRADSPATVQVDGAALSR